MSPSSTKRVGAWQWRGILFSNFWSEEISAQIGWGPCRPNFRPRLRPKVPVRAAYFWRRSFLRRRCPNELHRIYPGHIIEILDRPRWMGNCFQTVQVKMFLSFCLSFFLSFHFISWLIGKHQLVDSIFWTTTTTRTRTRTRTRTTTTTTTTTTFRSSASFFSYMQQVWCLIFPTWVPAVGRDTHDTFPLCSSISTNLHSSLKCDH